MPSLLCDAHPSPVKLEMQDGVRNTGLNIQASLLVVNPKQVEDWTIDALYKRVRKILADNLTAMVYGRGSTINAEARNRRIPQRSLENLTTIAKDPRLSSICTVAAAFGLQPWQLLVETKDRARYQEMLEWFALYNGTSPAARRVMEMALEMARNELGKGGAGETRGDEG